MYSRKCVALCVCDRGGGVTTWEASSGRQLLYWKDAHYSDTQCVDVVDDAIVSGSKDNTVKVNMICSKCEQFLQSVAEHHKKWKLDLCIKGKWYGGPGKHDM